MKTGVKYSYRVIANKVLANGKVVAGKSSSTNSATALLEGEPILTMKANGKTKFDLSWTRVEGATRYLVYRKSSSEGWKKILTLGGDVTSYTTSSMQGSLRQSNGSPFAAASTYVSPCVSLVDALTNTSPN